MVSGFAPRVVRFEKTGGVLTYQTTPDNSTLTLIVDFSRGVVVGKMRGASDMYFTIR